MACQPWRAYCDRLHWRLIQRWVGESHFRRALKTDLFDESDPAVLWMIESLIARAHKAGAKVGLCGQAPSNDPAFARLLVEAGIDSISVTPDSFVAVKHHVAVAEGPAKKKSVS